MKFSDIPGHEEQQSLLWRELWLNTYTAPIVTMETRVAFVLHADNMHLFATLMQSIPFRLSKRTANPPLAMII
jgi:hypothetical protein